MKPKPLIAMLIVCAWLVSAAGVAQTQAQPHLSPDPPGPDRDRQQLHTIPASRQAEPASASAMAQTIAALSAKARPAPPVRTGSPGGASARPAASKTVVDYVVQDFEDNWDDPSVPGNRWRFYDRSNIDGGDYKWGKQSCWALSGFYSAFTAGGGTDGSARKCTDPYPKNADSQAFWGPWDFSQYITGTLTIWFHGDTEGDITQPCTAADDVIFTGAGVSTAFGDIYGRFNCGNTGNGYYYTTVDLGNVPPNTTGVLGQSQGYIALLFFSDDDSNVGHGFSVDFLTLELGRVVDTGPSKIFIPTVSRPVPVTPPPPIVPCPDTEPNNLATRAQQLTTVGKICTGTVGANDLQDFYWIDATAGQRISIDLTNMPASSNYDLYLYNQAYASNTATPAVASSANPGNADEHINSYVIPSTQRYYIRIYRRAGDGGYHLYVR